MSSGPTTSAVILVVLAALWSADVAAQAAASEHTVVRPTERVGPPWLGLTLAQGADGEAGVEVAGMLRRSPADGTGVQMGDRVLEIAGEPVNNLREIQRVVRQHRPGDSVKVLVRRGKREISLEFKLAAMPTTEEIMRNHLIGYPAPEFSFRFVGDGKQISLSELRGKPTVIEFWATWCGPCHAVQAELAEVKQQFGEQIHIVGISDESAQIVRKHLDRFPAKYAMATDEGASRNAYAVQSIPLVVVLDAEHRVAAIVLGANQRGEVARKLQNLLPAK